MNGPEAEPRRRATLTIAVALLAGIVVLILLFPAGGVDPQPPKCFSAFGYSVPCEAGAGLAAAVAAAVIAGAVTWWILGRRSR